jgi:heme/copper-type cytochrome/quinol oxidase subunit 2
MKLALGTTLSLLGSVQFALAAPNTAKLMEYKEFIVTLINGILLPVLIAIAFIVFLYGVFKYFILGGADPKKQEEGRQFVLWGVIGFVVIFCIWGIVALVYDTLGFDPNDATQTAPRAPQFR